MEARRLFASRPRPSCHELTRASQSEEGEEKEAEFLRSVGCGKRGSCWLCSGVGSDGVNRERSGAERYTLVAAVRFLPMI